MNREILVLSIDPSHRGFGYAVLEGPQTLIDWGVKLAPPGDKNAQCLIKIKELIAHYRPQVIVVEDCRESRRRPRVRRLIRSILRLARKQAVRTKCFARSKVNQAFSTAGAKTKHEMATAIARHFPELGHQAPPVRRTWMSEDYWMSMFLAMALAMTFFYFHHRRQQERTDRGR